MAASTFFRQQKGATQPANPALADTKKLNVYIFFADI